jgi:hypothetical protein
MITSQGKSFKNTPDSVAPFFPFAAPAPLGDSGALVGVCMKSGRLAWLDPPKLMQLRVINGQVAKIIAPRDHGKSTFMKSVGGVRLLAVQAGNRNGVPRKGRLLVDDRKPEIQEVEVDGQEMLVGEGEYGPLSRFLHGTNIDLAELPSINVFHPDMGMKEQHLHELAILICELESSRRMTSVERFVLLIAVNKMYRSYAPVASPGTLALLLNTLSLEDRVDYYKERDRKILQDHAATLRAEPRLKADLEVLMQRHILTDERGEPHKDRLPRNIDDVLFLQAAGELTVMMENAQQGQFGGAIGNEHSLFDIMHSNRAFWNWTGISRKARTLLEFVRMTAQSLSLSRPELDIVPDVRLGDEERSAGDELIHLQHRLEFVEKARAFATFDLSSEQFDEGMATTLGSEGSIERGIVDLINQGTAIRFFGRQPYNEEHLNNLSKYGIADHDLYQMTTPEMEPGCWAVQTGGSRKLQWIRHVLVPTELKLIESNTAAKRQTQRIPLGESYQPTVITAQTLRRKVEDGDVMAIEPQE